jgi:hypothetical protein
MSHRPRGRPERHRRHFAGADLLRDLLEQADSLRDRQWSLDRKLNYLLTNGLDYDGDLVNDHPVNVVELQSGWRAFLQEGGVSAEDFDRFLQGERLGTAIRSKKHLRLVSNKTPARHRIRALRGNDAA